MEETDLPAAESQNQEPSSDQQPMPEAEIVKKRSRKRNIIIFSVVTALNVALLVLLWTQLLTPASGQNSVKFSNATTGDVDSPLLGKTAPDFTLTLLNGASS